MSPKVAPKPSKQAIKTGKGHEIPPASSIRAIRYLTLAGGGMKGIGDAGAIEELEEYGVLAQLEEVAGSSAGGLVATMLAVGCNSHEIRELMLSMDFRAFQDKSEVGWLEATNLKFLEQGFVRSLKGVAGRLNFLKHLYAKDTGDVSKKKDPSYKGLVQLLEGVEDVSKVAFGTELGVWKGEALTNYIVELIARKTGNPNITFRELAVLAEANGSPFKKLTLTGTNITDGTLEYYSAETTPDMPIALAARISASFPGGFKPVVVTDKDGNKKVKVDGGLLENLPDVFNKEPYVSRDGLTQDGANPNVFALMFSSSESEKPKVIKNGIHLVKALYATKMSDDSMGKKYGSNVARIDTVGMDTLEFDASQEKKEKLVASGSLAVRSTLEAILEQERKVGKSFYQKMTNETLIRIETELKHMIKDNPADTADLADQLNKVEVEIENRQLRKSKLHYLRMQAEKHYVKKDKLLDARKLTSYELAELCRQRKLELDNTDKQLLQNLNQLKLAKIGLEYHRSAIIEAFEKNSGDNVFAMELKQLKALEDEIKFARVGLAMHGEEEKEPMRVRLETLQKRRTEELQKIVGKYRDKGNDLLADFFADILEDCQNPDFLIPYTKHDIHAYCSLDINQCIEYIEECERELEHHKQDAELHQKYKDAFVKKDSHAVQFSTLLQLKTELDRTILRKTTLLTKVNSYILKKSPKFSKIMTPFLNMIGMISYVCWLPVGAPAIMIAKLVLKTSDNMFSRATADNVIHFFKRSNVDKDRRLRVVQKATETYIKAMGERYVSAQQAEMLAIFMQEVQTMDKNKIRLEDIFIRRPGEKKQDYQDRITGYQKQFQLACEKNRISKPSREEGEAFEAFRKTVTEGVMSSSTSLGRQEPGVEVDTPAPAKRRSAYIALLTESNATVKLSESHVRHSKGPETTPMHLFMRERAKRHADKPHGKLERVHSFVGNSPRKK